MVWRAHLPSLQVGKGLAHRRRNSEIPLGFEQPAIIYFYTRPARLGPRGRSCRGGIVGPRVPRIAPYRVEWEKLVDTPPSRPILLQVLHLIRREQESRANGNSMAWNDLPEDLRQLLERLKAGERS